MRAVARVALALVVIGAVFRVAVPLGAAAALAGVLGVAWLLPVWGMRTVEVTRTHPRRLFHDEVAEVSVTARNPGRWPVLWLSLYESVPLDLRAPGGITRWVVGLGPGAERTFTYRIRGNRRGLHRLGPAILTFGDVLGLRRLRGLDVPPTSLLVYPHIMPVAGASLLAGSPRAALPARLPLFPDPTRVAGARPYRPRDSLRTIHWTASAAHGELLSKVLEPGIGRDTVLCLDVDRTSYRGPGRRRRAELAVTAAASLASHVVSRQRLPVGLLTSGTDPATGRRVTVSLAPSAAHGDLLCLLEALAQVRTHPGADLPALLDGSTSRLPWGATLVVLTGRVDDRLAGALMGLKERGFLPSVVEAGGGDGAWSRRLERHHIPVRRIDVAADVGQL